MVLGWGRSSVLRLIVCISDVFRSAGDCGEGAEGSDRRSGQEEVPGAVRPDRGPVLLPHQEAHPPATRGRSLLLRQQRDPAYLRHHGNPIPGQYNVYQIQAQSAVAVARLGATGR